MYLQNHPIMHTCKIKKIWQKVLIWYKLTHLKSSCKLGQFIRLICISSNLLDSFITESGFWHSISEGYFRFPEHIRENLELLHCLQTRHETCALLAITGATTPDLFCSNKSVQSVWASGTLIWYITGTWLPESAAKLSFHNTFVTTSCISWFKQIFVNTVTEYCQPCNLKSLNKLH